VSRSPKKFAAIVSKIAFVFLKAQNSAGASLLYLRLIKDARTFVSGAHPKEV
jgi:hypothetical protein